MIISKCPLRISLVGGSTDLQSFIDLYNRGSVISFTPNLFTYINLNYTNNNLYRIICSKIEVVENPNDITNDIAREVVKYFNLPPVKITFDSDIKSAGSGLASSSSYLLSMIKAVDHLLNLNLSISDICEIGIKIERKFNPLTGYQDIWGCGWPGGLKRLNFYKNDRPDIHRLDSSILNSYNMYLVDTGIHRSSTDVLSSLDLSKSKKLLDYVDDLQGNILNKSEICNIINQSWDQKKKTSSLILNDTLKKMDDYFNQNEDIKAVKLCGAGAGGFFFVLSEKEIIFPTEYDFHKIKMDFEGLQSWKI